MDVKSLDRIVVTSSRIVELNRILDTLTEDDIKPNFSLIPEGILVIKNDLVKGDNTKSEIYFSMSLENNEVTEVTIVLALLNENGSEDGKAVFKYQEGISSRDDVSIRIIKPIIKQKKLFNPDLKGNQKEMFFSMLGKYSTVFQYSMCHSPEVFYKKVELVPGKKKEKKLTKKERERLERKQVSLNPKKKVVYVREGSHESSRSYDRHTELWTQRGHWRQYKSGKRIWIKPQEKGPGKNKTGKDYTV